MSTAVVDLSLGIHICIDNLSKIRIGDNMAKFTNQESLNRRELTQVDTHARKSMREFSPRSKGKWTKTEECFRKSRESLTLESTSSSKMSRTLMTQTQATSSRLRSSTRAKTTQKSFTKRDRKPGEDPRSLERGRAQQSRRSKSLLSRDSRGASRSMLVQL